MIKDDSWMTSYFMGIPINLYFTCLYACVYIYFVFDAVICFIITKQGLMEDHQIGDMCRPV